MRNIIVDLFSPNNDFFQLAKDSKRITHISLSSFILPVIFLAIAAVLTQFVFAPLFFGDPKEALKWTRDVFGLLVIFGSAIVLIFLWVRFFEGRRIKTLGFPKEGAIKKYLSGFVFGMLMNTIVVGIMALLGSVEISEGTSNFDNINVIGIVLLFLLGFIIQGAGEEILTRGWMLQVIGSRYKPWLGLIISTIFFAVVHLGNAGVNPASVINLLLVAILLCLFVMNEGSLWFACAWHSAWNWTLGNFYGLSVSGKDDVISVFNLNTTGNELISGGGFGPEGSLVTSFVLLVANIWFGIKIIGKQLNKSIL